MPPNWGIYFRVPDINQAAEKIKANGGQVTNGSMEVPGGDMDRERDGSAGRSLRLACEEGVNAIGDRPRRACGCLTPARSPRSLSSFLQTRFREIGTGTNTSD